MPKKRNDGRYEIKVRISREGEPRKYKAVYGSTLKEAQKRAKLLEAEVAAGVDAEANPTVEKVITDWLKLKAATARPQTVYGYTCNLKQVTSRIGGKFAKDINVPAARKVIAEIAEDVSVYSANRCRKLLCAAWKDAVIRGVLVSVPWDNVPIRKSEPSQKRRLSDEELAKIDRAELIPLDRALISVLRYTGCRIGEAMALLVEDIDFDGGSISITKTLVNGHPGPPKTKAGTRKVVMPQVLACILRDYIDHYHSGDGVLFPSSVGTYIDNSSRNDRWKRIKRQIFGDDAPEDFTPHIFRHTYASMLVANNVPPTTAQLLLGHDSLQTTLGVYTHFGYSDIDKAAVLSLFENSSENSSNSSQTA